MDLFSGIFEKFGGFIMKILPTSPFLSFINKLKLTEYQDFVGYLNWFIPVHDILLILSAWLGSIALFYLYSVVLRWIKVISG